MELGDILDIIIDKGSVAMPSVHPTQSESLRVMMIQKFKRHKELLDSVGYLPEDMAKQHLSFKYNSETWTMNIKLATKRPPTQWKVVGVDE